MNNPFGPRSIPLPGTPQPPKPAGPAEPSAPAFTYEDYYNAANKDYLDANLSFNPYQTSQGGNLEAQNYDPYGMALQNTAASQAGQARQNAYSQLQQSGKVGAADRMSLANKFNEAKIQGTLGAFAQQRNTMGQAGQNVDQYNLSRGLDVSRLNSGALTQAARAAALANATRKEQIFGSDFEKAMLDRQLATARELAAADAKNAAKKDRTTGEMILDPTGILFGPSGVINTRRKVIGDWSAGDIASGGITRIIK
jgi:hypothetical protein